MKKKNLVRAPTLRCYTHRYSDADSVSLAPSEANAATYYVAKTGSDSKSYTSVQSTSIRSSLLRVGLAA